MALFTALAMVTTAMTNLVPTQFGFPAMSTSRNLNSFVFDHDNITDDENVGINFDLARNVAEEVTNIHTPSTLYEAYAPSASSGTGIAASNAGFVGGLPSVSSTTIGDASADPFAQTFITDQYLSDYTRNEQTHNILPFGPVNLAFPTISQSSHFNRDQTHMSFNSENEASVAANPGISVG
jgi:hypothetical protein